MTVTADTVLIGGKKYLPAYVLETYDNGIWTQTAQSRGGSFTVTANGTVKQRLTCKWMPKGTVLIIR